MFGHTVLFLFTSFFWGGLFTFHDCEREHAIGSESDGSHRADCRMLEPHKIPSSSNELDQQSHLMVYFERSEGDEYLLNGVPVGENKSSVQTWGAAVHEGRPVVFESKTRGMSIRVKGKVTKARERNRYNVTIEVVESLGDDSRHLRSAVQLPLSRKKQICKVTIRRKPDEGEGRVVHEVIWFARVEETLIDP